MDSLPNNLFGNAAMWGVPLTFIVWMAVEYIKRFTNDQGDPLICGNHLLLSALAIGTTLGLLFGIAQNKPPQDSGVYLIFVYWAGCLIYGLACGLLAALFHDNLKISINTEVDKQIHPK